MYNRKGMVVKELTVASLFSEKAVEERNLDPNFKFWFQLSFTG